MGDCVAVERGQYANIRRVADLLCQEGRNVAVEPTHLQDAEQCHAAKEQLLAAGTETEIDAATRKVTILCQY